MHLGEKRKFMCENRKISGCIVKNIFVDNRQIAIMRNYFVCITTVCCFDVGMLHNPRYLMSASYISNVKLDTSC